jgi:hypothetical protein
MAIEYDFFGIRKRNVAFAFLMSTRSFIHPKLRIKIDDM